MPEYCTCGTRLVEDARFCHRCGRPTTEPETPEAVEIQPAPIPRIASPIKPPQLPVSFSNPIALRVGFLISLAMMLLIEIPIVNRLFVVWWLAGGWCAVLLYRRLTGLSLTVPAGARLGSITGVLQFVSMVVVSAVNVMLAGKEVLEQITTQNPEMAQIAKDPTMLVGALVLGLFFMFLVIVGICAAGGALGARFNAPKSTLT